MYLCEEMIFSADNSIYCQIVSKIKTAVLLRHDVYAPKEVVRYLEHGVYFLQK